MATLDTLSLSSSDVNLAYQAWGKLSGIQELYIC